MTSPLFVSAVLCCADATEVLQEDVMEFVNSIAQIVHSEVCVWCNSSTGPL